MAAFLLWLVIGSPGAGQGESRYLSYDRYHAVKQPSHHYGIIYGQQVPGMTAIGESMKNLENLNLKLRAQRHDYMNHLQVIYGLLELGNMRMPGNIWSRYSKDITRVTRAMKTSQPAVNALLQAKMESAEKKGVDMIVEVGTPLKEIPLEPWELCKLLANLIDNGITALEEKEGEKKLAVEIRQDSRFCYLCRPQQRPLPFPKSIRLSFLSRVFFHQKKKKKATVPDLPLFPRSLRKPKEKSAFPPMKKETCFAIRLPR